LKFIVFIPLSPSMTENCRLGVSNITVHACNPSYHGGGGRRIMVQGQTQAKVKTLSENKLRQKGLEV
jgi:hypothetical protein